MFGMSFVELGIVAVVALLLLGPDQLPGVARTIGKGLRDLRRASDDLKHTFEQEMVKLETEVNKPPRVSPPRTDVGEAANAVVDVQSVRSETSPGATVFALDQARQAQLPAAAARQDPGALRAQARAAAVPLDPGAARAAARIAAAAPAGAVVDSTPIVADSTSTVVDSFGAITAGPSAVVGAVAVEDKFEPLRNDPGPAVETPKAAPPATVPRQNKPDPS